ARPSVRATTLGGIAPRLIAPRHATLSAAGDSRKILRCPPRPLQTIAIYSTPIPTPSHHVKACRYVSVAGRRATPQHVALRQQRSQLRSCLHPSELTRTQQHMREPRVDSETCDCLAVRSDSPVRIEGAQVDQQITRAVQSRGGWGIEPPKVGSI